MQMSDALACNFVGEFETVVSKCLAHGRRKVIDVMEHFPEACRYVIEVLAKVYAIDAHCRQEKMAPPASAGASPGPQRRANEGAPSMDERSVR